MARENGQWHVLFDIAISIFAQFRMRQNIEPAWTFGGGTALMLQIDHRESHDIDLFLHESQSSFLPYLNPETQGFVLTQLPDDYAETAGTLKLAYKDIGEIDFICCANILENPAHLKTVRGRAVRMETPAEIIAKKIYYRGGSIQTRDMFDLAAVIHTYGIDYAAMALKQCGRERLQKARASINSWPPEIVAAANSQLMVRGRARALIKDSQSLSSAAIEKALASLTPPQKTD